MSVGNSNDETNQSVQKSYRLSGEQLLSIYNKQIHPEFLEGLPAVPNPLFIIICAQPGAGKSAVSYRIRSALAEAFQKAAHIDPDELRKYHARMAEIEKEDPVRMGDHTHEDASVWKGFLLESARDARNNVVTEVTLASTGNTKREIQNFQSKGYGLQLHAIAVHEDISRIGILSRFERAIVVGKETPRYVSMDYHDAAYKALPVSVNELETGFPFDLVTVNTRAGDVLYSRADQQGNVGAMNAILLERNRAWTKEENSTLAKGWDSVISSINARPDGSLKPDFYLADLEKAYMQAFNVPIIKIPRVAQEQNLGIPAMKYQRLSGRYLG